MRPRAPRSRRHLLAFAAVGAFFAATAVADAHHITVKKVVQGLGSGESASSRFSAQSARNVSPTAFSLGHDGTRRVKAPHGTTSIRITEAKTGGYASVGVRCTRTDGTAFGTPSAANRRVDVTITGKPNTWGVCTFTSRKTVKVKVGKRFDGDGLTGEERVRITVDGSPSGDLAHDGSTLKTIRVGSTNQKVHIRETGVAGTDLDAFSAGIACTGIDHKGRSRSFVTAGGGTSWKLHGIANARAGSTVHCTITNTRRSGELVVKKQLTGTPFGPVSFSFTGSVAHGRSVSFTGSGLEEVGRGTVATGVEQVIAEDALPEGYSFDQAASSCDGGATHSFGADRELKVTIPHDKAGENVTCTFVNTPKGKLVVTKDVVNDDGGTMAAEQFTLNLAGGGVEPQAFPGSAGGTVFYLTPGVGYAVGETEAPGYAASIGENCVRPDGLEAGEVVECVVTNDDIAPELKVIKVVDNSGGGTLAPADFQLLVSGTGASPSAFPGAPAPGTTVTLNAGSYAVTELDSRGYIPSFSDDCSGTIALGESRTCTVTNTWGTGRLVVRKLVVNDNGGTLSPGDFTLTLTEGDGPPQAFPGSAEGTEFVVDAGVGYAVRESGMAGYAASIGENCVRPDGLEAGEVVECVVTNDDIAPRLTVVKNVDNSNGGGDLAPGDFTLAIAGTNVSQPAVPGSSAGVTVTLNTGSYSVTEPNTRGYTAFFSDQCSGTIALGESRTCTVTNVSPAPTPTPEPTPEAGPRNADVIHVAGAEARSHLAALRITKTAPRRALAGTRITYVIRVRNTGTSVARGVVLADPLPPGLVFVRSVPRAQIRGSVISVRLGDLPPGRTRTVRLTVRSVATIGGRRTNIATVRATGVRPVRASAPTVFAPLRRQLLPAVAG